MRKTTVPILSEPGNTREQPSRREKKENREMYGNVLYGMQDRVLREQEFAERVAERQRCARAKRASSLRARITRGLFELAVAAEREETWRLAWERLEARAGCKAGPLAVESDVL